MVSSQVYIFLSAFHNPVSNKGKLSCYTAAAGVVGCEPSSHTSGPSPYAAESSIPDQRPPPMRRHQSSSACVQRSRCNKGRPSATIAAVVRSYQREYLASRAPIPHQTRTASSGLYNSTRPGTRQRQRLPPEGACIICELARQCRCPGENQINKLEQAYSLSIKPVGVSCLAPVFFSGSRYPLLYLAQL